MKQPGWLMESIPAVFSSWLRCIGNLKGINHLRLLIICLLSMVVIQYLRVPLLEFPGLGMMKPWVFGSYSNISKKKSAGCFFSEGCLGLLKTVRIGNFRSFTAKRCLQKMTFGFQKEGSIVGTFSIFFRVNSLWNLVIGFLRGGGDSP